VGRPTVFLDRDGVLNHPARRPDGGPPESPLDPGDVRMVPRVAEPLAQLRAAGFALVVVSNQPGAAKGQCTPSALQAVHDRVVDLLSAEGITLDGWFYCHHHPEGPDPQLGGPCSCRKPEPGLLLTAAAQLGLDLTASWMVGDSDADIAAGRRAGCGTVLVEHPDTAHRRGTELPDLRVPDLPSAARLICGQTRRSELAVDA
jgi:D-glycero-D-manno-heptose 1,7-bisphosphate phosphatase